MFRRKYSECLTKQQKLLELHPKTATTATAVTKGGLNNYHESLSVE